MFEGGVARYGAVSILAVGGVGGVASILAPAGSGRTIGLMMALAWSVQVAAFAWMMAYREAPSRFMRAWLGGIVARFGLVIAVAAVLVTTGSDKVAPALLSLVSGLFVLLLLEIPFLKQSSSRSSD